MKTQTQTIEFEAPIEGNIIRIPERYRDASRKSARVFLLPENAPDSDVPNRSSEKKFMQFVGMLSDEDYQELVETLKDTERVDIDEW